MSDDQWLRAIARYDNEGLGWFDEEFKGGSFELSQVLEESAKEAPERFARLLLRFPPSTVPAYHSAVLRGLGAISLDAPLLMAVCLAAHERRDSEVGRWLVRLIEHHAPDSLPEELLEVVARYMTADPDPEQDNWRPGNDGETALYGGDLDMDGLNSTRGAAALAVHALVSQDTGRLDALLPALREALNDSVIAVRACAIGGLFGVLVANRDLAVQLFLQATEDAPDDLFRSQYVERFVYYAGRTHLDLLLPTLHRMARSGDATVAAAGARQLAVASLGRTDLDSVVDGLLGGSSQQRSAAVGVFASNVTHEPRRKRTAEIVTRAFDDPDRAVRDKARSCFWHLESADLTPYPDLFQAFAYSKAMEDRFSDVFRSLKSSCSALPDTTLLVCERWLQAHGNDAGDIATHAAAESLEVSTVVLRLYAQHRDPDIRRRCVDVIDAMITAGAYGIREELASLDR